MAALVTVLVSVPSTALAQADAPETAPAPEAAPAAETAPAPEAAPAPEPAAAPEPTTASAAGDTTSVSPPIPAAAKDKEGEERQLGPHWFPAPAFLPSAFITTHFSLRQGVTQLSVTNFPLTATRRLDVSMVGLTENFEFGVRLFDRLELFGTATGQVVSGIEVSSLLTLGMDYSYQGGGGAAFRLLRLESSNTQLSVRARGVYDSGGSMQMLRLIDALNAQDTTIEQLFDDDVGDVILEDTWSTELTLHLLAAQSIGKHFGLQAALGVSRNWLSVSAYDVDQNRDVETSKSDWLPEGSLMADANLDPIPIGFSAEYVVKRGRRGLLSGTEDEQAVTHLLGLSLHTVHPRFQISLTGGHVLNLQPVTRNINDQDYSSDDLSISYGQISVHTYW